MKTRLTLISIGATYIAIGFYLYAGRIRYDHPILESDVAIFLVPALLAMGANSYVIGRILYDELSIWKRARNASAYGLATTFVEGYICYLIAFNTYGT